MTKRPTSPRSPPTIGLALGGGGARGIAHILMLEVFDELGIKPAIIVGTSIGAVYGAAYAAGLPASLIRAHTEETLSSRFELVRQLVSARAPAVQKLFNLLPIRAGLLSPSAVLEAVLPSRIPGDFAKLAIPLAVVATDFHAQEAVLIDSGPLQQAVAASIALPALFQPVSMGGRTLIDGGLVNPLPFDLIHGRAEIIVAVDVSGGTREDETGIGPGAFGTLLGTTQIMQRAIVREKLKSVQPDIYVDSTVEHFNMLEFHRFKDILASAAPAKAALKRQLERVLAAETIEASEPVPAVDAGPASLPLVTAGSTAGGGKKKRLLLPRRRAKG